MFITKSQLSLKYFSSYNKQVGFRCGYIQGLSNIARTLPLFLSSAYYLCSSFHIWFCILLQINFLQNHKGRFLDIILYLFTANNTSWREYSPSFWKVVAELWKMLGFLASGEEKFNPGPVTRLDRSELLCNRVLLKQ